MNYEYEDISYNLYNNVFIIQRNGKQGAVTKEGKTILHPEYDSILFGGIYLNAVKDNETFIFDLSGNQIQTDALSMTKTDNPNYFIVIDKNDENYGMLEIGEWEHWPNENRLKELMELYCRTVEVRHGLQYDEVKESDLYTAWIGKVK